MLAEATEKYEVCPASNACRLRMRSVMCSFASHVLIMPALSRYTCSNPGPDISDNYALVLAYAYKHGHMDIMLPMAWLRAMSC